jgi:hypothetical protein
MRWLFAVAPDAPESPLTNNTIAATSAASADGDAQAALGLLTDDSSNPL